MAVSPVVSVCVVASWFGKIPMITVVQIHSTRYRTIRQHSKAPIMPSRLYASSAELTRAGYAGENAGSTPHVVTKSRKLSPREV